MLVVVSKMRNKRTGEVAIKLRKVKQVDYEFECEALADLAYQLPKNDVQPEKAASNKEIQREYLVDSALGKESKLSLNELVELSRPAAFTQGKIIYSQIKDPFKLASSDL